MISVTTPNPSISWVDPNERGLRGFFRIFESSGIKINTYQNYSQALAGLREISNSNVFLTELIIDHGDDIPSKLLFSKDAAPYIGLRLIQDLRAKGISVPMYFFTYPWTYNKADKLVSLSGISYINKNLLVPQLTERICEITGWKYYTDQPGRRK